MKEEQKYKLKRFKFLIDLIEFQIKYRNDPKVLKGKKNYLNFI